MEPLFDKPMVELREAFVLTRFAEPAVFGRRDIEEWLHNSTLNIDDLIQSRAEWGNLGFIRHLERELGNAGTQTFANWIRDNATELEDPPSPFLASLPNARRFYALLNVVRKGGTATYHDWSQSSPSWPVLITHNEASAAENKECNKVVLLREATIVDVIRILLAEVMDNRPKRERALAWLSNEYTHAITKIRLDAERDFDEAVAVSADGTKIVKVEEVLVIAEDWRSMIIYPASAFTDAKILRSSELGHRVSNQGTSHQFKPIERYVAWFLMADDPRRQLEQCDGQLLETGPWFDKKRRLITEARYCPSPLPDGGREIRV